MVDIAAIARSLPDVTEGIACAGTKLESVTYQVRKKSFLFVSATELRLKLDASVAEAQRLGFTVGANGWVTARVDVLPNLAVIRKWIAESHALAGGLKLAAAPKRPPARRREYSW